MHGTTGTSPALQLRWLRLKRHFRSTAISDRVLRDTHRALASRPGPRRRLLCGRATRLAA
jgi:hypothetical protein